MKRIKRIGVLTAGGDCPGLNSFIEGIVRSAEEQKIETIGIIEGFSGLVEGKTCRLDYDSVRAKGSSGGTILGCSREKPYKGEKSEYSEKVIKIKRTIKDNRIDCVICAGGNGSLKTTIRMSQDKIPVVFVPKTIDMDVPGTDYTVGFDSALNRAVSVVESARDTARSHRRVMVVELMGHKAGWLALGAAISALADIVLIPEVPFSKNILTETVNTVYTRSDHAVLICAEGIARDEKMSASEYVCDLFEDSDFECRSVVPGYFLRGGNPSAFDRMIASQFSAASLDAAVSGKHSHMVSFRKDTMSLQPISSISEKIRLVENKSKWLTDARTLGIKLGDEK